MVLSNFHWRLFLCKKNLHKMILKMFEGLKTKERLQKKESCTDWHGFSLGFHLGDVGL